MLIQLRDYIAAQGRVSSQQLARQFHMDEEALKSMLTFWVDRRVLTAESKKNQCGGCLSCHPPVYYSLSS